MGRLPGFDYRKPFFYMVTLAKREGIAPFGSILAGDPVCDANGAYSYHMLNAIGEAFSKTIAAFHERWRCLNPIECFCVMPDHLHLLVRLLPVQDPVPLGSIVLQLEKALATDYWRVMGGGSGPVFKREWHDWIVKRDGQLATFTRYIRENPMRAWLRKRNARYFGEVRKVKFIGREWFAYGNLAILELPEIAPFRCSRKLVRGGAGWNGHVARASRIGPGGAGMGTFMSPCEIECGRAIGIAGGKWIVLSPEGFGPRWHPPREKERFCAAGRMLYLSAYAAMARQPTKAELYHRCHEMGDWMVEALSG